MERLLTLQSHKKATQWYLRALWGMRFDLHECLADEHNLELLSYVDATDIFLPAIVKVCRVHSLYYRAAACHAAAHTIYGNSPFDPGNLNLTQRSLIGLVEDLRVELLAIKQFPGLRNLWLAFHGDNEQHSSVAPQLMLRLSRGVLAHECRDGHAWVNKGRRLIRDLLEQDNTAEAVLGIGLQLANDLGQMRIPFNTGRYEQAVMYRDDNRSLWQKQQSTHQHGDSVQLSPASAMHNTSFIERTAGLSLALAMSSARGDEGYLLQRDQGHDLECSDVNQETVLARLSYPEWDYRSQILKQGWCTVTEYQAGPGSAEVISRIYRDYRQILERLKRLARKVQLEKHQRLRKREEGDDIEHEPMLSAMVALRCGEIPDTRIFMRNRLQADHKPAICILLDISESTNEPLMGTMTPLHQLLRNSVALLGEALSLADEQFAIYGFCSDGRHQVKIRNFKTFAEPFRQTRQRLSAISGEYSTRLGTAVRHCAQQLATQPQRRKLLLVITDGVPSDIDVFDQDYLRKDSWHAVQGLARAEITPFCVNLDARSDATIEGIFGRHRYQTLDNVSRLPEVLSRLYFRTLR
ncbi:MAG: VWA domain-containing protein [Gammaproteobacteria bacterium]|nr:VWA domain-containing protein [Gammaproteobacteria bacterium]